MKPALI